MPKNLTFTADENESILDAAKRANIKIRQSCINGVCEICRATLQAGVVQTPFGRLHADHPDVNPLLTCVSYARSDLILELNHVLGPGEIPLQHIAFQVTAVTELQASVFKIDLLAPAGKLSQYHAGQYLELLIDGNEYPFTIANAPGQRELELHLGVSHDNESSSLVLQYLQNNSTVRARLPKGSVWLKPELNQLNLHDPLLFVVAGTGFAQAKAMIEEQLKHQHSALHVYWINREVENFYMDQAQKWADEGLIQYRAMCSQGPIYREDEACQYYTQQSIKDVTAQDFPNMDKLQVVACGGPGFVYSILDELEETGLKQSQMQSDVFAYAPRPSK